MILLQKGNSLNHWGWFMPESMPLQLSDSAISTASITIGPDAPEITVGDWLLDDSGGPGDGIVWRAKGVETNYATDTRTVTLEHVLATLQDEILSGEHTTNAISGKGTATARQALEYALKGQSVWVLGDCDYDRTLPYSFTNTTRYAAITTVCGTLADWCWEYDLKKLPFKLHVRKKSSEVGCELRMGRNLTTLKVTVDRSQMYTRFYPVGQRSKMLPEKYLEKNTKYYGVIEHTATDQSKTSEAMLRAWAEEMLDRHAEPSVSVSISGLELSAATGEPLDKLRLGKVCRVPLPKYGVTIRERITKLQWSDALRDPVTVSVTLANSVTDVSTIIKQISGSSSSNAGGSAKAQEEDHAWIVDTADHVGLVAEAIVGREGETVDWSRVSSIIVDGEGIHQRVTKAQGDIITAQTAIEMNEEAIALEAQRAEGAEAVLRSSITVEAGRITSLVERTGVGNPDEPYTGDSLFSRVTQTADAITSEVTRATAAEGTLSSQITQTATAITSLVARTGVGGLDDDPQDTLFSRITQTATAITSEVTRATAAEGTLSSRITQTATSITSLVERTGVGSLDDDPQDTLFSRITQTATAITSEVTRATAAEGTLSSRITQTATSITSLVERTGVGSLDDDPQDTLFSRITQTATAITSEVTRATAAEGTMSSRITQNANRIALVVTSVGGEDALDVASIVAGINDQSGSYVRIKAKYINLDGYVTMSTFSALDASITNLLAGRVEATKLAAKTMGCSKTFIYKGYKADWKSHTFVTSCSVTMPSVTLSDPHYFLYSNSDSMTPAGRANGRVVVNYTGGSASINSATLYFLERGDAE